MASLFKKKKLTWQVIMIFNNFNYNFQ